MSIETVRNRVVFIQGIKTVLRPLSKETDLDFFIRTMNDPEITRFLKYRRPVTRGEEEKWFNNLSEKKDDIILAIEDIKKPGIIIGDMGIHKIDWLSRIATTGAVIGDKTYWGKGYGSDAKMFLLKYVFDELNLRKIFSSVWSFNCRSKAYSEKCGYRIEAVLSECVFREGKYWDKIFLSIVRDQWFPIWEFFIKNGGKFPPKKST